MTTNTTSKRAAFSSLRIGDRFHVGKSRGIGANSHLISWEVLEKISPSMARVVENHGGFRGNTIGHCRSFSSASSTWPV